MNPPLSTSFLEWRDEWTLEVGFMDEDHRHLDALVNRLARDFGVRPSPGQPPPQLHGPPLSKALEELAQEARLHFQREEEVMRTDGYPNYADHKADHDLLLAELSVLIRELQDARARHLDEAVLGQLKDWLLGHVLDFDRRLADFLKNPEQVEPAPVSSD
jgi:methyl-accepting chemotaxis protein